MRPFLAHTDDQIGRLLGYLEVTDQLENTLIVLVSDTAPVARAVPTAGRWAFNTPFKMWKRYEFEGGTSDPCIISWPKSLTGGGEIRHQYHHAIDIVPTVLDYLGVESPATIKGHVQADFDGLSMRYSFNDGAAPGRRKTQFYSMLGSRGIWHEGYKAVSTHPTISGWSHLHDLAAEQPGTRFANWSISARPTLTSSALPRR